MPSRQVGIFIRAFEKLIRPWPFKGHFTVKIPTCPLNVQEIPTWPMLMRPLKKSQQRSSKFSSQITWWSTFILDPSRSTWLDQPFQITRTFTKMHLFFWIFILKNEVQSGTFMWINIKSLIQSTNCIPKRYFNFMAACHSQVVV